MDSTTELERRLDLKKSELIYDAPYDWAEGTAEIIHKRTEYPHLVQMRKRLEKAVETGDWQCAADIMGEMRGGGRVFQIWLALTYEHNDDRSREGLRTVLDNVLRLMAVKRLLFELLDEGRGWLAQRLMENEHVSKETRDSWLIEREQKLHVEAAKMRTMYATTGTKILFNSRNRISRLKCIDGRSDGRIPPKNLNKV